MDLSFGCRKWTLLDNDHERLTVHTSTIPWIDSVYKWGEFPEERAIIGKKIQDLGMSDRVLIMSGDAHMLAADDGSHSVGGVKVLQAAALDAKPTIKGGPYSQGAYPGRNQYGTLIIEDRGDEQRVCATFEGWRWIGPPHKLKRMILFNTCKSSLKYMHVPYYPSPRYIQKAWKWYKGSVFASLTPGLIATIDSYSLNVAALMAPSLVVVFCTLVSAALWARYLQQETQSTNE